MIEEIKKRLSKATPGDWVGVENSGVYVDGNQEFPVFETGCGCCTDTELSEEDAEFIGCAKGDIAFLLSLIERSAE